MEDVLKAPGPLSKIVRTSFFFLLSLAIFLAIPAAASPKKVIIDTDPGTDDAMAIMLALNSPELDVRALTVVAGNVVEPQGLDNALRMVSLANRCDIPVAAGAQQPLAQKLVTAEFWHGKNGLANIELPASKCKVDSRRGRGPDHRDGARRAARNHAGAGRAAHQHRSGREKRSFHRAARERSDSHGRLHHPAAT